MTKLNHRILFISHDAQLFGASRSLIELLNHFVGNNEWELQILSRKGPGPLLDEFQRLAPTQWFYSQPGQYRKRVKLPGNLHKYFPQNIISNILEVKRRQKLIQQLKDWGPDLVYSNTAMNGDLVEMIRKNGTPVIVHVRELETFLGKLTERRLESFLKTPVRYLSVSAAVKDHLIKKYAIAKDLITVIPPSICPAAILREGNLYQRERIRRKFNLPSQAILVGAVGRADLRKGVDLFIHTAAYFKKKYEGYNDVFFMWLGGGPELGWMKDSARDFGFEDRFIYTGMQKNPYSYMSAMDILLMCSREDPFPRVNLEAGILGKPILAFNGSGGSCEFVESDCGYMINPFDTDEMALRLIQLVEKPNLRKRFGINARKKAFAKFSSTKISRQVARIINSILIDL